MGVRINFSKTYKTVVNFTIVDANGKPENCSFTAEFKRLTSEEIGEVRKAPSDTAMARQVLVGWKMEDIDTKEDIPFTPDTLDEFLKTPGASGVTMLRFLETVAASREKN